MTDYFNCKSSSLPTLQPHTERDDSLQEGPEKEQSHVAPRHARRGVPSIFPPTKALLHPLRASPDALLPCALRQSRRTAGSPRNKGLPRLRKLPECPATVQAGPGFRRGDVGERDTGLVRRFFPQFELLHCPAL